jgi:hypothetical protein
MRAGKCLCRFTGLRPNDAIGHSSLETLFSEQRLKFTDFITSEMPIRLLRDCGPCRLRGHDVYRNQWCKSPSKPSRFGSYSASQSYEPMYDY